MTFVRFVRFVVFVFVCGWTSQRFPGTIQPAGEVGGVGSQTAVDAVAPLLS